MNKVLLVFSIFISSICLNAQTEFSENFLGNDYLAYKGVKLTLKENAISGFMYVFYSDLSYCQSLYDDNVIYPEEKSKFNTSKDSLVGRVFLVKDIIDKTGSPILKISYLTNPLLVLEDTLSKQVIYFKYDGKYSHKFPFLTSKIEISKEVVCSKITRVADEMTDETTLRSPLLSAISIIKNISSEGTFYYLSLRTKGSTVVVDGTGVIILFNDGTKMTKPVEIDVDASSNGFDYSAFITLTQKDLVILSTKEMKKFRLYIYDQNVKPYEAEEFTYFVKCVMEMK